MQDIADLQKELFAIPAQYRGGDAKEHIHYYQEGLPLGEYGNSTLQDNERAITIYQRELESAIKQQERLTETVQKTSEAREREADASAHVLRSDQRGQRRRYQGGARVLR